MRLISESDIKKAKAEVEWLHKTEPTFNLICWLLLLVPLALIVFGVWSKL